MYCDRSSCKGWIEGGKKQEFTQSHYVDICIHGKAHSGDVCGIYTSQHMYRSNKSDELELRSTIDNTNLWFYRCSEAMKVGAFEDAICCSCALQLNYLNGEEDKNNNLSTNDS